MLISYIVFFSSSTKHAAFSVTFSILLTAWTHEYTSNRNITETDQCPSQNDMCAVLAFACMGSCVKCVHFAFACCAAAVPGSNSLVWWPQACCWAGSRQQGALGGLRDAENTGRRAQCFGQCDSLKYQTAIVMCHVLWVWRLHHSQQVELKVVKYHMVSKNEYTEWAKRMNHAP